MAKHSLKPPAAYCFSAPRRRGTFGSDAITPIPSNGFTLATRLEFMLCGDVAFPEQNSPVPARATEILAQPGEELAFVEPGNPSNGVCSP
jgi:hypothetical protein